MLSNVSATRPALTGPAPARFTCALVACALVVGGLAATTPAHAAKPDTPKKLLVQRIDAVGVDPSFAVSIEEAVVLNIGQRQGYSVVTPAELEQTVKFTSDKAKFGCDTNECLAEVQKKLGADRIVGGTVGMLGSEYVLTLSLIDTAKGAVLQRVSLEAKAFEKLREGVPALIDQLLGVAVAKPAFTLPAGQSLKLAVMPMSPRGIPDATADAMTQILSAELNQIKGVSVISQDDIKAMLNKVALEAKTGCTDNVQCIVEIGAALGLSKLVSGSVGKVKDTYVIAVQLIDTRKAEVQNRVLESFAGDADELKNAVKLAAYRVVGVDTSSRVGAVDLSFNVAEGEAQLGEAATKVKASTLKAQNLKPGRYALRVITDPDTYYPLQTDIYVAPGATNVRSIEVVAKPTPWYKTWWFWTVTGVVLAGAAGTTAYFLLQDSTPPPGEGTVTISPPAAALP